MAEATCGKRGERDVMINELPPLHVHDGAVVKVILVHVNHSADVRGTWQREPVHATRTRCIDSCNYT